MRERRISDDIKLFDEHGTEIRWSNRPEIETLRWLGAEPTTPVRVHYVAVRGARGWALRGLPEGYTAYAPVDPDEVHYIRDHTYRAVAKFSSITALRMYLKLNAGEPLDPT